MNSRQTLSAVYISYGHLTVYCYHDTSVQEWAKSIGYKIFYHSLR
jgi:hypothetical protein